jgi:uncharacterized damage-inducible protein DinB
MSYIASLCEYYHYNDWARDKLMSIAGTLTAGQLDRPFEMGEGSLRATLRHLYGSERLWLERWRGVEQAQFPHAHTLQALDQLWQAFRSLAAARNAEMAAWRDADLKRSVTYERDGQIYMRVLGDMLLHSCTHGVHHRAQALNMLRNLGATLPQPGLDYVFMKLEEGEAPPPKFSRDLLRKYFEYGDWAGQRAHAVAAQLRDEQLDRAFDIGMGSLRHTLAHIATAEQWWFENWTLGPGRLFPEADPNVSIAELARKSDETHARRNQLLATLTDGDLLRPTTATPRTGIHRTFPLGVTMLQLGCHGVHHRAQVLNMFRHVGAEVPALDVVVWLRTRDGAAAADLGSGKMG